MITHEPQTMQRSMNRPAEVRRPIPPWLAALGILLVAVAIGIAWRFVNPSPVAEPPPDGRGALAADALTPSPTAGPTELPPSLPTATPADPPPTPEKIAVAVPTVESAALPPQQPATTLPLPTVTPTPEIVDIAPRTAQIGGSTTLRVALSGQDFESAGRPLRFSIDVRHHELDGGRLSVDDAWCMQLGLANLYFDLNLRLDSRTEDLVAQGRMDLRSDFCDAPGPLLNSVEVNVSAPTGATAQIAYNLRGERAFFGQTNLLNTSVGVIVDLEITNSRPR